MDNYLRNLISQGENQQLDFKYCVSDSRKIAKTLSAFANSDGGRLLIGVRDNGSITGIRSDEEIYMVETAAQIFCRPEISYTVRQHTIGNKNVLEVEVKKGDKRPYRAKDEDGKWISYFRSDDQTLTANRVLLQVWRKEANPSGVLVRFGKDENILMDHLAKNGPVSLSKFRKIARISPFRAETILSNLIVLKIIIMKPTEKGLLYELNPEPPDIPDQDSGKGMSILSGK